VEEAVDGRGTPTVGEEENDAGGIAAVVVTEGRD
jgi:hypothetical protein